MSLGITRMFQQMELALGDAPKEAAQAQVRSEVRSEGQTEPRMEAPQRTAAMSESDLTAEAKAAFVLHLRARGIRDLAVLRALEKVPREIFVPHRYADLASRDICLPIACGQTLSEPWLVARMIESLRLSPSHRVLEIGTGSGYATAILAEIAQTVMSLERFQSLAIAARLRLERLGITNASVVFGDGLAVPRAAGPFDRILVHGSIAAIPSALRDILAVDGRMVLAKPDPSLAWRQSLVEVARRGDGSLSEEARGVCRLQQLVPGLARIL
jgi:protein-L-isoaspartate(D-aspartate) O-methyltransferase